MSIKQFFRSGRWRPWAVAGGVRAVTFLVLGLIWFWTEGLVLLLYPEAWLADLRVAALASRVAGAVWLPSDSTVSLSLGPFILVLIVADTLALGYVCACVSEALRRRRNKLYKPET